MKTKNFVWTAVALALAVIALVAYLRGTQQSQSAPQAQSEPEILYWYDPMRPDQHFDAPGRSPFMDMDLVPKYASEVAGDTEVLIDPAMVQNLGMRTAKVTRGTFFRRVDTTGRIEADERKRVEVFARAPGWVEVLHVGAEGDPVRKGQVLAEIYSPMIATAQGELLLALQAERPELVRAARTRLLSLGVDARAIERIESTGTAPRRTSVFAPIDGYVMQLGVRAGAAVMTEARLFELSDHSVVWILAEVPERESSWIGPGRAVEARVSAHPGRVFSGVVDYVYPDLDVATRTRRVRMVVPNEDDHLHPGMYADVTLFGGGQREQLLVPTEAVIRTGERTLVIVAKGDGRFKPASIRIGGERGSRTVVLDGLDEGDEVVTSGQFLIDSEASLLGVYRRMDAQP